VKRDSRQAVQMSLIRGKEPPKARGVTLGNMGFDDLVLQYKAPMLVHVANLWDYEKQVKRTWYYL
jgi:hypothetical protein